MSFGERLKNARKKSGITQKELAEKLNVSAAMIAQYETGKRNPKKETLSRIAEVLNLGYSYTKDGEPYFYSFVDTVRTPENAESEEFNNFQYNDSQRIIKPYNCLNDVGKEEAVKQVELLTKIPEYRKDNE